jgi:hypothetical protein
VQDLAHVVGVVGVVVVVVVEEVEGRMLALQASICT